MTLYGLIGKKLGHSFSASYFNSKFEKEGIDARYELFEIPSIEGVSTLISNHRNLKGLNVTIPYKKDILPYLDSITDEAAEIGAVNCVKIERKSATASDSLYRNASVKLTGHNTDAPGFRDAIAPLLKPWMKRALLLGQGGASLAVINALRSLGIEVTKVSRRKADGVITYSEINKQVLDTHHIIVNCTPLGMYPNIDEAPDIPYNLLSDKYLCFDLVYNPEITKFMRLSTEHGATVSNGLQMLHNQADLAWLFWNSDDRVSSQ